MPLAKAEHEPWWGLAIGYMVPILWIFTLQTRHYKVYDVWGVSGATF